MIDCKKCIHFPICMFKNEAASEIDVYNSRTEKHEPFNINLSCNHYATVGLECIKRK